MTAANNVNKQTEHVLCSKCATSTNVDTDIFDSMLANLLMVWGSLVSATRRLMECKCKKNPRAAWSSMYTLMYAMAPLHSGDPQLECEPMGNVSKFETDCGATDAMDVDRSLIKAKGFGIGHSRDLHALMQSIERVVTDLVEMEKFTETQPTLSLINAMLRLLMSENKPLPVRNLTSSERELFAHGAYNRHVNRCYEYDKSKPAKKRTLSCKWLAWYAIHLCQTALRATHEWANGRYEKAEILAALAVNAQVPGKKIDKGGVSIDWRCRQLGPKLTQALDQLSKCEIATIFDFDKVETAFRLDRFKRDQTKQHTHLYDMESVFPTLRMMILRQLIRLVSAPKISNEAYRWIKLATDTKSADAVPLDEDGVVFVRQLNALDRVPTPKKIVDTLADTRMTLPVNSNSPDLNNFDVDSDHDGDSSDNDNPTAGDKRRRCSDASAFVPNKR